MVGLSLAKILRLNLFDIQLCHKGHKQNGHIEFIRFDANQGLSAELGLNILMSNMAINIGF